MTHQHKLRVAICGGGIAGLTLSCALSQFLDIQIDVYESASRFAEIGAGVGLWWRPRQVLSAMGLEKDMSTIGCKFQDGRVPSLNYRKADQFEGAYFATLTSRGGLTTLHRPEFQTVLLHNLSSNTKTHNSKCLASYTQPVNILDPIRLFFTDGTSAECDVLVGADGIKSSVRANMLNECATNSERRGKASEAATIRTCIQPRFAGAVAYRIVIPGEKLAAVAPHHRVLSAPYQYIGKDRHLIAYPISHGRLVNVAMFNTNYNQEGVLHPEPWVSQVDAREISRLFDGWELEVRQIISCIEGNAVKKWVVNTLPSLPTYSFGRVVLIGDAAHAMNPYQGAGAGQAIEDAYMLAQLLGHDRCTRNTIPKILQHFSQTRIPATRRIAELSRRNGMLFALREVPPSLPELGRQMQQCFDDAQDGDPLADVRHAIKMLESS